MCKSKPLPPFHHEYSPTLDPRPEWTLIKRYQSLMLYSSVKEAFKTKVL